MGDEKTVPILISSVVGSVVGVTVASVTSFGAANLAVAAGAGAAVAYAGSHLVDRTENIPS